MKKMKYLRTWLVVALVVTIIGSLTGGTVAWFTDSVESTGNVIESGTLDVKLYAVDKKVYDNANGTFECPQRHRDCPVRSPHQHTPTAGSPSQGGAPTDGCPEAIVITTKTQP